jgi:hypothetical protein
MRDLLFFKFHKTYPRILTKNWIYDLIQGNSKTMFVAEIQGPEDQKDVKLRRGILRIKRGYNFAKIILLGSTNDITISDCIQKWSLELKNSNAIVFALYHFPIAAFDLTWISFLPLATYNRHSHAIFLSIA